MAQVPEALIPGPLERGLATSDRVALEASVLSSWDAFIEAVGPMCMGRTTYEWMLQHHPDLLTGPEQWEAFYGDRPAWVFTHRTELPTVVGAEIRFVQGIWKD